MTNPSRSAGRPKVVIIGAGIGGLATALRLASQGIAVTVIDSQPAPGGKMRSTASPVGPIDCGPTVLTLRHVFDALFAAAGESLADHVTLLPLATLARHHWDDGASLDLMADPQASAANVHAVFGPRAESEYLAFSARAARLFQAFDAPVMQSATLSQADLVRAVLARPRLLFDMAPWSTLAGMLRRSFTDPRLAQLFGRYATYVGGSPYASPALLGLVWHAEQRGVWAVAGGMQRLAQAVADLAQARGAVFHHATTATRIELQSGRVASVHTAHGRHAADVVVFNGDPHALRLGLLGAGAQPAVLPEATLPRSLSAYVHAFAATVSGPPLAHHTVFFAHDPKAEFAALAQGQMPTDASLYVCAQDRVSGSAPASDTDPVAGQERFEIIMNGPAGAAPPPQEKTLCQTRVFDRLRQFGLTFGPGAGPVPVPGPDSLTVPGQFAQDFPGSLGSLYGRSPQGLLAAFRRPVARSRVPGLYLAGGGAHPGAGVPMAALSGLHAAEAIMTDHAFTLTSRRTATPGGTSTGCPTAGPGRSLSSDS